MAAFSVVENKSLAEDTMMWLEENAKLIFICLFIYLDIGPHKVSGDTPGNVCALRLLLVDLGDFMGCWGSNLNLPHTRQMRIFCDFALVPRIHSLKLNMLIQVPVCPNAGNVRKNSGSWRTSAFMSYHYIYFRVLSWYILLWWFILWEKTFQSTWHGHGMDMGWSQSQFEEQRHFFTS